ncbi:helix-turn-helix domain-containing protein [Paenibacillus sp. N4]|uniref:helix-turn-helix domain-containing protein n=1 Tax=Paenibacillus vietnamensis TaxID=2590547 RepID=UPI001CD08D9E|nr:helix-turn-helix domain-containing protein [Paenibacillus vietnamensis]MCA0754764.1 helix-turn-helix domain-containing protein [Paenibacillus vietnamensis]
MNFLFDPVAFNGDTFIWTHGFKSDTPYPGFYHWHQCMELLFVHEGEGTVIVNQHTYEARPGMLFLFQPFQLHKIFMNVSGDKPYRRSIAFFEPSDVAGSLQPFALRHQLFMRLWQGRTTGPAFDLRSEFSRAEAVFEGYEQMSRSGRGQEAEEVTMLLLQLLGLVAATGGAGTADEGRPLRYSEQIMQLIETNYREELGLEQLAERLHLSKYYVSRVFHEETGSHITDYLTARRVKQACRLLQSTSLSVEQVGIQVGYPNVSYFISLFKKVVGTTPLKYRRQHVADRP